MNIKRSLIILITMICVTLNVAGIVLYKKQEELQKYNQLVDHTYVVITHIQGLNASIEKMIAGQHGFLLTANQNYTARYNEAAAEMKRHFNEMKKLTEDNPVQQKNLAEFSVLIRQIKPLLHNQMESTPLIIGNLHISVHDDFNSARSLTDAMRALSDKMLKDEELLLTDHLQTSKKIEDSYIKTLLVSSLVSVAVILFGTFLLLRLLSHQRRTQDALDVTRDRLELALKGTNDGIFDWSVNSKEIYLSPRFREILGYSHEELPDVMTAYESIVHPEDLPKLRAYTQHYLKENLPDYRTVFRLRHKNGAWRWHMVRAISVVDQEKKKLRLVGAHTDITDQKTLEERITASNKELEEFTYVASHDLRSPLVNLKGFAGEIEHILKQITPIMHQAIPQLPAEQQAETREAIDTDLPQAIGFIKNSVTRMDRLTQAILDLSRLGRRELKFFPLDMEKLVDTSLKTYSHQLAQKNIAVSVNPLPLVIADAVSMEQIFGNILDNAIKYLDPTRPGTIEIGASRTPTETVFTVTDNGRGIAENDVEKIFEIFKRAGNNQNIPGEGMGMPYIKSILRRHGGKIWCTSTLGVGTTFHFTVPYRLRGEAHEH